MDLELLLRACWRHKVALLAAAVIGALVVAGGGVLLVSPKYASSADVQVIPVATSTSNSAAASVYSTDPDRYVATQVQVMTARNLAIRVGLQLHLGTDYVVHALNVLQVDKSDVVRVTATTTSASLSASVANTLVNLYVSDSTKDTAAQFKAGIASINGQLSGLDDQVSTVRKEMSAAGISNANSTNPLSLQLTGLLTQESTLLTSKQQLVEQSQTNLSPATVVSNATPNPAAVGPGTKKLGAYGAALGLAIALSLIAVANRPGQTLDDFEGVTEFAGFPMLGLVTPVRRWRLPGLGRPPAIEELRNMRVADELTNIVQLKGAVQFVLVGPPGYARQVKKSLAPLVLSPTSPDRDGSGLPISRLNRRPADVGEFTVISLATFLPGQVTRGVVVVGIGLDRVSRPQLDDVLTGLSGIGAEVLGIVGIR